MRISPEFGNSNKPAICKSDDFPDPELPISDTISPFFTERFTLSRTFISLLP